MGMSMKSDACLSQLSPALSFFSSYRVLQSTVAPVEGRLRRRVPNLPVIKPDRLKTAKMRVAKAVKLRKVFSVQGPYPVIRAALWARGWVERHVPHAAQRATHYHGNEEDDGDDGADVTGETTKDTFLTVSIIDIYE
ncbi:Tubulin monoglycylase TTLL3 [Liparis tanakae]|uniref:Tubulin monoglycylase TTLL3 n=1 Tax=Liparis tanakae TaxID=230148 RepID=A0A4Z2ITZ9_9TELE|nr:Tubulin monoglycylase TTLL3 [Liparis tanakae]